MLIQQTGGINIPKLITHRHTTFTANLISKFHQFNPSLVSSNKKPNARHGKLLTEKTARSSATSRDRPNGYWAWNLHDRRGTQRLPRWRSVWESSCGTAARTDLARTCNRRGRRALGVGTLIRRGEYLGRCPYRRNMAGDARGDLRLEAYSSVGRAEGERRATLLRSSCRDAAFRRRSEPTTAGERGSGGRGTRRRPGQAASLCGFQNQALRVV
jgi:hypothetical protein